MQRTSLLAFAAGVAATASVVFLTGFGPGDDHDHDHHGHDHGTNGSAQDHGMSPEEEMAAYMASIMPGEEHAAMGKYIGTWDAKTSFVMDPNSPPVEGVGTMTCDWQLGGRYVRGQFHMDDMMGMPFDGLSYAGFNNITKQHVSVWMDTFGTGIIRMTGHVDEQGVQHMSGITAGPAGDTKMEIVTEWDGKNSFSDTFYDILPDGTRVQSGHIVYTRR